MSDSNHVALITGTSRGLGAVIARVLAERGYDLVVCARDEGPLQTAAESFRSPGGKVVAIAGDITDDAVRVRLVDAARKLGGLNVLVNNASELGGIGPLSAVDLTRFARVMQVNVGAAIALIQRALPLLAERGGLIVNISSDAAHGAYPGWGPYGASKAALELVTRTLAGELSVHGVSAIAVDPGDMRTRMHQEAFPGVDISDRPLPEITIPFWNWLLSLNPRDVIAYSGQRFAAQQEDARWRLERKAS